MNIDPRLPILPANADSYQRTLSMRLNDVLRDTLTKVGLLQAGSLSGRSNQRTTAPTAGTWAQGDEVRHSAPVEAGTVGSKYVVLGWVCVSGGTPGTWREMRVLTGN